MMILKLHQIQSKLFFLPIVHMHVLVVMMVLYLSGIQQQEKLKEFSIKNIRK
jgi:hypothetical protein